MDTDPLPYSIPQQQIHRAGATRAE